MHHNEISNFSDEIQHLVNSALTLADDQNYEQAIDIFEKVIEEVKRKHDHQAEIALLKLKREVHCKDGAYELELVCFEEIRRIHEETGDFAGQIDAMITLAEIYLSFGEFGEGGIDTLQEALELAKEKEDKAHTLKVLRAIAALFAKEADEMDIPELFDEAVTAFDKAVAFSVTEKDHENQIETLYLKAKLAKDYATDLMGDPQEMLNEILNLSIKYQYEAGKNKVLTLAEK